VKESLNLQQKQTFPPAASHASCDRIIVITSAGAAPAEPASAARRNHILSRKE
jgi:hypothetical protein